MKYLAFFAVILVTAACGEPDKSGTQTRAPETGVAATPAKIAIPDALRGRWGLVPADCTSTLGDAKGLLTVTPQMLQFHESRGTLKIIAEQSPTRIVGDFDFTGEGMTWQRRVILDAEDGGRTLVRREFGADAAPDVFRYARCDR